MTMAGMKRRYREPPTNWGCLAAMVANVIIVLVMVLLFAKYAHAHDHGRPDLTDWYKALRTDSGPCCDGSDSQAIEDPDWESQGGHYRVRIEGNWVEVPAGAVLPGPNLDGRALVWPYTSGGVLTVRCFMRGREM